MKVGGLFSGIGGWELGLERAGFDIAWAPKPKLFGRGRAKGPRLLGQCVSRVDGAAVADAWARAGKWGEAEPGNDETPVAKRIDSVRKVEGRAAQRRSGREQVPKRFAE